jgi:hypothetical protein
LDVNLISYLFLPSFLLSHGTASGSTVRASATAATVSLEAVSSLSASPSSRHGHSTSLHVVGHHGHHRLQSLCASTRHKRLLPPYVLIPLLAPPIPLRGSGYRRHCIALLARDPTRLYQLLGKRRQKKHFASKG